VSEKKVQYNLSYQMCKREQMLLSHRHNATKP